MVIIVPRPLKALLQRWDSAPSTAACDVLTHFVICHHVWPPWGNTLISLGEYRPKLLEELNALSWSISSTTGGPHKERQVKLPVNDYDHNHIPQLEKYSASTHQGLLNRSCTEEHFKQTHLIFHRPICLLLVDEVLVIHASWRSYIILKYAFTGRWSETSEGLSGTWKVTCLIPQKPHVLEPNSNCIAP